VEYEKAVDTVITEEMAVIPAERTVEVKMPVDTVQHIEEELLPSEETVEYEKAVDTVVTQEDIVRTAEEFVEVVPDQEAVVPTVEIVDVKKTVDTVVSVDGCSEIFTTSVTVVSTEVRQEPANPSADVDEQQSLRETGEKSFTTSVTVVSKEIKSAGEVLDADLMTVQASSGQVFEVFQGDLVDRDAFKSEVDLKESTVRTEEYRDPEIGSVPMENDENGIPTTDDWCIISRAEADDQGFSIEEEGSYGFGFAITTKQIVGSRTVVRRMIDEDGEVTERTEEVSIDEVEDISSASSRRSSTSDLEESTEDQNVDQPVGVHGITVFTRTNEDEPEFDSEMNECQDVLPDGTVVRRCVTTTRRRQTFTKCVVLEGFDDDLPISEGSSEPALHPFEDQFARLEASGNRHQLSRYSDKSCTEPEQRTDIQLSEETAPGGLTVKKRVTTKRLQQLTTERLVVAGTQLFEGGDEVEDEVFGRFRLGSPTGHLPASRFDEGDGEASADAARSPSGTKTPRKA
jgi:hypothetical protein